MELDIKEIDKILNKICKINSPKWDCDGSTRFVGIFLLELGIDFKIFKGSMKNKKTNKKFPLHYWIEIDNFILDYKFSKWIGGEKTKDVIYYKEKEISKDWITLNKSLDKIKILNALLSNRV